MRRLGPSLGILLLVLGSRPAESQEADRKLETVQRSLDRLESKLNSLDSRVQRLESKIGEAAGEGAVLFLYGVFCALWAKNSGRSAWLWFFLGLFFSVITVIVLLVKNAEDARRRTSGI